MAPRIDATTHAAIERSLQLAGRLAAFAVRRLEMLDTLADAEFRVSSQFGEDGIIEWLCHNLPGIPRSFVEFGVGDYSEANTRFLLQNRGWRGLIMDSSAPNMQAVRDDPLHWMHDLTARPAFITVENINDLIAGAGFTGQIGILSVDIDGNDYWVLEAIRCVDPAIIICEINGVFGDLAAFTIPYDPEFDRLAAHHSGQYFGCSIAALSRLCAARGYTYLGTAQSGVNAFFVRNDVAPAVTARIRNIRTWPARHRDSRSPEGALTFVRGMAKVAQIRTMPVHDVSSGRVVPLETLYPLYSPPFEADLR